MAERSFKDEVKKLRLSAGQEFRGEAILAVTKALLQSGVSYVAGYQGAPISHLMDVLADANDILADLGVHFESSASEATAAATLAASVNYLLCRGRGRHRHRHAGRALQQHVARARDPWACRCVRGESHPALRPQRDLSACRCRDRALRHRQEGDPDR